MYVFKVCSEVTGAENILQVREVGNPTDVYILLHVLSWRCKWGQMELEFTNAKFLKHF